MGIKRLITLSEEDKQGCIDAYKFFQRMQAGEETSTEDETRAVADYYKVLNNAEIERVNARGERVNWHSLRHTFGTLLGAANVDPTTLMKLMLG